MTLLKTTLLAATAALGLASGASADPSNYSHFGHYGQGIQRESVENRNFDVRRAMSAVQVQRFTNPQTGRNFTSVIQNGHNNGLGVGQTGRGNAARVIQNGNNTNVVVNQNGNFNSSAVFIFGH